jgi:hypothetical protein
MELRLTPPYYTRTLEVAKLLAAGTLPFYQKQAAGEKNSSAQPHLG